MRTFSINTLGCKVNQYESQQIRALLEQLQLRQADSSSESNLVVVNTCCVTHTASAKSRQCIHKARRLNPNAVIVVCGCLAAVQIGEMVPAGPNIHLARNQQELAAKLRQIAGRCTVERGPEHPRADTAGPETSRQSHPEPTREKPPVAPAREPVSQKPIANILPAHAAPPFEHRPPESTERQLADMPLLSSFKGQTRAFLKVQDGCDRHCSYCIVPRTRPLVRSKPPEMALAEARRLAEAGHREIVITGVCLGAYGQPSTQRRKWPGQRNVKLAQLLEKLSGIAGLPRIRLSSLDPADITPELLDVMCEHDNIMPHLHLSLQSGSARILKRMRRQYTPEDFCRLVEYARARLDRPAITTDIIVGFPGETDADFEQTLALASKVGFSRIHVFAFSPRRGTAAARMQGAVSNAVVKQRSRALQALNDRLAHEFREQFIGRTAQVLIEGTCEPPSSGHPRPARAVGTGTGNGVFYCQSSARTVHQCTQPHTGRRSKRLLVGRSERYFPVYVAQDLEMPPQATPDHDLLSVKLLENGEDGVFAQTP